MYECAFAAWFNFVATIDTIQKLAGESGLLISLVIIMRLLPTLFLFPVAGVVADRQALLRPSMTSCPASPEEQMPVR